MASKYNFNKHAADIKTTGRERSIQLAKGEIHTQKSLASDAIVKRDALNINRLTIPGLENRNVVGRYGRRRSEKRMLCRYRSSCKALILA